MTLLEIRIIDTHHNNETVKVDELTSEDATMLIHECEQLLSNLKDKQYEEVE